MLMDFFEVVKKRKAIRKYIAGRQIPEADIAKILETASLAPSARNLQGYKIFAAKTPTAAEKIFKACYNQRSDFIKNAALILVFCTDPEATINQFGARGEKLYALQDATIAATFALLSATALGYASCWVGNFREKEIQEILQTPLLPVAAIVIGYSEEHPERPPRKPLEYLAKAI